MNAENARMLLHDALALWWLRPENGLAIASYCLRGTDLEPAEGETAADFACGDGVNTFFKCGGRFDFAFDVFSGAVKNSSAREILARKEDIFDHVDDSYSPAVSRPAACEYAFGTDHKPALLEKARRLGFYRQLLHSDLREAAPMEVGSLDLLYCNSLYWIENPADAFELLAGKVKSGGRLVLDVMTQARQELDFSRLFPAMPAEFSQQLNRGRQYNNPGILSEDGWDRLFDAAGPTRMVEKRDIFPTAIARAWNVGLRPIFPVLNRMAQAIASRDERLDIKREWVETWTDLLLPVLMSPEAIAPNTDPVRIQYVLSRR